MNKCLIINITERLPPGVERAILSEGDHMVGGLADSLGACVGGLDASVPDELGRQRAQKRLALVCRLIELGDALAVAHRLDLRHRRKGHDGGRRSGRQNGPLAPCDRSPPELLPVACCSSRKALAGHHGGRRARGESGVVHCFYRSRCGIRSEGFSMMRRRLEMLKNEIGQWKMKEEGWRSICKVDAEPRSLTMMRSSSMLNVHMRLKCVRAAEITLISQVREKRWPAHM